MLKGGPTIYAISSIAYYYSNVCAFLYDFSCLLHIFLEKCRQPT